MTISQKSFEDWKATIDRILWRDHTLFSDDLPDCPYRDWWEDGVSVRSAAARARLPARSRFGEGRSAG